MKTKILLSVLLIALLSPTSCRLALTREAKKVARQCYEDKYIQCGHSTFGYHSGGWWHASGWYQWKGLSIRVRSNRLSQADRANRIEWKGDILTPCNLTRTQSGSWKACKNGPTLFQVLGLVDWGFSMQKKDDVWTIGGQRLDSFCRPGRTATCAELEALFGDASDTD